ncbi:DUF3999 family protein [Duganella sp. LX20W]|uniref:DUF3999 family protein n=1 Tax=Rugamonas brunnea TaxID=2758569 RepID=A0A7W2ERN7_9BURK|nr:DUF3999 family protein [Rugamonas brunnea]MBA5637390.1 DUF3999 family protein [Rugamonas brunnea]
MTALITFLGRAARNRSRTCGFINIACLAMLSASLAWASDMPQNYGHSLPLTGAASQGVLQVRLPREVYLYSRSPDLADLRVFDMHGAAMPFSVRSAVPEQRSTHRTVPCKLFALMDDAGAADAAPDLDVHTGDDGRLLSVHVRSTSTAAHAAAQQLTGLILEPSSQSGQAAPLIDALRFTPPPGTHAYNAQIWLETSDDLKQWDVVGATELNWLVNQDAQSLSNDKLTFDGRRFRYARLRWQSGKPLMFARIDAEEEISSPSARQLETILLDPKGGRQGQDVVYETPIAIGANQLGLKFSEKNIVLPVVLGHYRELPPRQLGQASVWRFEPALNAVFYHIQQGQHERDSGDVRLADVHTSEWVLRPAASNGVHPQLRLSWEPATLVFLASGSPPYTLAIDRDHATTTATDIDRVAPGFSVEELRNLPQLTAGPARLQQGIRAAEEHAVKDAASAARRRLWLLWGLLLLGMLVLSWMVWRLLKQDQQPTNAPDNASTHNAGNAKP